MSSNKKYWKSVEELNENSSIVETLKQNEFVEQIPTDEFLGDKDSLETSKTTRRDFLKYVGFSTAAASLAACEGPVIKSIPYVVQPEEIVMKEDHSLKISMAATISVILLVVVFLTLFINRKHKKKAS